MKYNMKNRERILLLLAFVALEVFVTRYVSAIVARCLWPGISIPTNGQALTLTVALPVVSLVVLCILHYVHLIAITQTPLFRTNVRRAAWAKLLSTAAFMIYSFIVIPPDPFSRFVVHITTIAPVLAVNFIFFRKPGPAA